MRSNYTFKDPELTGKDLDYSLMKGRRCKTLTTLTRPHTLSARSRFHDDFSRRTCTAATGTNNNLKGAHDDKTKCKNGKTSRACVAELTFQIHRRRKPRECHGIPRFAITVPHLHPRQVSYSLSTKYRGYSSLPAGMRVPTLNFTVPRICNVLGHEGQVVYNASWLFTAPS
eukprot:6210818-Pleurochrysis_carterae.AAC.2